MAEDHSDATLQETRSRFIAGFSKRCSSIEELIVEVEAKGSEGPLLALKQIVHRLSGLAMVVGLQTVSARAIDSTASSTRPAPRSTGRVRRAFDVMQDAFTTDLAGGRHCGPPRRDWRSARTCCW